RAREGLPRGGGGVRMCQVHHGRRRSGRRRRLAQQPATGRRAVLPAVPAAMATRAADYNCRGLISTGDGARPPFAEPSTSPDTHMPFYEYQCSHCGHCLEALQKISDAPLRKCPSCGRNTLKKLVSAPVFRLKGSGWYETDFKSDQERKRNLAGAEREAGDSGAGKDDKPKTEADSAAKADSG